MDSIEAMEKKKAEMDKKLAALTADDKPLLEAIKKGKALLSETKSEPE